MFSLLKLQMVFFQMDLSPFISKSQCECLNESDDHPLAGCLTPGGGFLQSDCDEQVSKLVYLVSDYFNVFFFCCS